MNEKRLTSRLIKYWWEQSRQGRPMPLWEEFDRESFADVWKQCCGWSVEKNGSGSDLYTFIHVGDAVKEVLGGEPKNDDFIATFKDFPEARIIGRMDEVVNRHYPLTDEGEFINSDGKSVKFRSCLLPFTTQRGNILYLVLGLSWKIF